jgi:hypothetical protein
MKAVRTGTNHRPDARRLRRHAPHSRPSGCTNSSPDAPNLILHFSHLFDFQFIFSYFYFYIAYFFGPKIFYARPIVFSSRLINFLSFIPLNFILKIANNIRDITWRAGIVRAAYLAN